MHAANEVGYPNHTSPEAAPVLRLCASLVCEPGHGGFFYTNDVRVLIDVIVRELTNLPAIEALEGSEETGLIEIKSMYVIPSIYDCCVLISSYLYILLCLIGLFGWLGLLLTTAGGGTRHPTTGTYCPILLYYLCMHNTEWTSFQSFL